MKEKIITILMVVISMLFLTACTTNTNTIDDNSTQIITLERTGMYTVPEYAHQLITITQKGYETKISSYNRTLTKTEFVEFKNDEFKKLIKVFEDNNFENLKQKYTPKVNIADIGQGIITYKNKNITINPYISEKDSSEISNIINVISDILYIKNDLETTQPGQESQKLKYQGMQCETTPWNEWYNSGEINYFAPPTQKQLIKDYYSTKFNINIENIEEISNGVVCEACSVCPAYNFYEIELDRFQKIEQLQNQNWKLN